MRPILSIAACALVLAGCADVYDKAAEAPACMRGAEKSPALQVSGSGLEMSGGLVIPGRYLSGSGKLDANWGSSSDCVRQQNNETKSPKSYDLQKIGMTL